MEGISIYNPVLDTFIQVCRDGSFTKAADHLFISPVSVMKQINHLEEYIGVPLFERSNQGVSLTDAGKIIYDGSRKLKSESQTLILQARDSVQKKSVVRIGSSLLRTSKPLLNVWSNIGKKHPEYQLDIVPFQDDPLSMQNMFLGLGKNLDIFAGPFDYSETQLDKENYTFTKLQEINLDWGIPKENPLSREKVITLNDLKGQTVMLIKPGYSKILDSLRTQLEENNIGIVNYSNYYDITAFNECVQKNYIMETLSIWNNVHPSITNVKMNTSIKYKMPYGLIYSREHSEKLKKFIHLIIENYK